MSSSVHYSQDGDVAVVKFDDGKANALSMQVVSDLIAALTRAEAEAKAFVLTGREGRFCAGFDLRMMMSGPEGATTLLTHGSDLLLRVYASKIPTVVACTGHAVAGGAMLALVADYRIGARGDFRIGLNEVAIGLPIPILAMELARDRLLPSELTRATQLAHQYSPDDAQRAGYLDEAVSADEVLPRAIERAKAYAAFGRFAFAATRERLRGKTIAHIRATLADDLKNLLSPA